MNYSKILIVEDELIIAENLRLILNNYKFKNVDVAINDEDAIQQFKTTRYDLVLMDINLGENSVLDGIDLIKKLKESYSFNFLFVTANADKVTVEKAKTTNPAGYIVKPFMNNAIYANVTLALKTKEEKEDAIFILQEKGLKKKVTFNNISHLTADGSYTNIHTLNNEILLERKILLKFSELLPENFIRIHKSTLINVNYIQKHSSKTVVVNNKELAIGRAYRKEFLEIISK